MKKIERAALAAFVVALSAGAMPASAGLIFDRGLPNSNLNDAAGDNRSNVSWGPADVGLFTGDDFSIGVAGQKYLITSITVWGAQLRTLSDDIDNIELYVGKSGSALSLLASGAVTGNTNSNPNITHTPGTYPDGTTLYQGSSGGFYSVMQTTFTGLALEIEGGVLYNFGVYGDDFGWWSHASNAALSGTPQQGADNLFKEFDRADLSVVSVWDSAQDGWNKSSDINIRIEGNEIPEPASLALVLAALGLVTGVSRQRKAHA